MWPDPDRFDPDRFGPGQAKNRPPHAYKPFGTGKRSCIGRQFALHEAVLALGLILHRYQLDGARSLRAADRRIAHPQTAGFQLLPRRDAELR